MIHEADGEAGHQEMLKNGKRSKVAREGGGGRGRPSGWSQSQISARPGSTRLQPPSLPLPDFPEEARRAVGST